MSSGTNLGGDTSWPNGAAVSDDRPWGEAFEVQFIPDERNRRWAVLWETGIPPLSSAIFIDKDFFALWASFKIRQSTLIMSQVFDLFCLLYCSCLSLFSKPTGHRLLWSLFVLILCLFSLHLGREHLIQGISRKKDGLVAIPHWKYHFIARRNSHLRNREARIAPFVIIHEQLSYTVPLSQVDFPSFKKIQIREFWRALHMKTNTLNTMHSRRVHIANPFSGRKRGLHTGCWRIKKAFITEKRI